MNHQVAQRAGGPTQRTARIAAFLFAFDPVLVFFARQFWTETLFLFFLLLMIDLLLIGNKNGRLGNFAAAGIVLGFAGLTRPIILPFSLILTIWILYITRRNYGARAAWPPALKRVAVFAGAAMLVVAPWTTRNFLVEKAFILVDTNGPYNFYVGNNPKFMSTYIRGEVRKKWNHAWAKMEGRDYKRWLEEDIALAQKMAIHGALQNIREYRWLALKKAFWSAGNLWELDNFLIRHLRRDAFKSKVSEPAAACMVISSVIWTVVISLAGLVGLATGSRSPLRAMVVLLMIYFTLVYMLTYSLTRYSIPFRPLMILFGTGVLCYPRELVFRLKQVLGRPVTAVVLAFVLVVICIVWWRDIKWKRFSATPTEQTDQVASPYE
jgi:hypothetical protein